MHQNPAIKKQKYLFSSKIKSKINFVFHIKNVNISLKCSFFKTSLSMWLKEKNWRAQNNIVSIIRINFSLFLLISSLLNWPLPPIIIFSAVLIHFFMVLLILFLFVFTILNIFNYFPFVLLISSLLKWPLIPIIIFSAVFLVNCDYHIRIFLWFKM